MKTAKFNTKKWRNLAFLLAGGFVLAASHQNCAPASPAALANGAQPKHSASDSQTVTVIDSVKKDASLTFSMKAVEVHRLANEISLPGGCSSAQEGSVLGWEIREAQTGYEFAEGLAVCEGGRFSVDLAPAQELECGTEYVVRARLGMAAASEMTVSRLCD